MKVKQLLALAGVVVALPLVALVARDIIDHASRIDASRTELDGVERLSVYRGLLEALPRHRESVQLYLSDAAPSGAAIDQLAGQIDTLIAGAVENGTPLGAARNNAVDLASGWSGLQQTWRTSSPGETAGEHARLLETVASGMDGIARQSGLVPSRSPQTYQLASLLVHTLPATILSLNEVLALGLLVEDVPASDATRVAITRDIHTLNLAFEKLRRELPQTGDLSDILESLEADLARLNGLAAAAQRGETAGLASQQFGTPGTGAMRDLLSIYDAINTALTRAVQDRVAGLETARNIEIAALILSLGLVVLLLAAIGRTITQPIGKVVEICRQMGNERYDPIIDQTVRGDMGKVVGALDDLQQRLVQERQTRQQAEHEREMLRDQFVQSQKMEALGTLASGIAHDFNNIIAAIIGQAELAIFASQTGQPIDDRIARVVKAGMRAKSLVTQILSFSRQGAAETKPVQPAAMLRETIDLAETGIGRQVKITTDIDESTGQILINPSQCHQLLMNMLVNAGNAVGESNNTIACGLRTVRGPVSAIPALPTSASNQAAPAEGLWLGEVLDADYANFWVADDGIGMDHETLVRIFDPFFTTGQGSGLGLAATQGIVLSAGGAVHVGTTAGIGSRFDVFLPLSTTPAVSNDAPDVKARGAHVLLVDDNEDALDALAAALRKNGITVDAHARGNSALTAFRKTPSAYDIVVTDYAMPVMTGLDLIKELRATRPDLQAILISGQFSDDVRSQALAAGVGQFIEKPFHAAVLRTAIVDALDRAEKPSAPSAEQKPGQPQGDTG